MVPSTLATSQMPMPLPTVAKGSPRESNQAMVPSTSARSMIRECMSPICQVMSHSDSRTPNPMNENGANRDQVTRQRAMSSPYLEPHCSSSSGSVKGRARGGA